MRGLLWTAVGNAFRRTALPLLSYYALTLAVPLANGAALSDPAFVRHAIVVLVVPPFSIILACAVYSTLRDPVGRTDEKSSLADRDRQWNRRNRTVSKG